MNRLFVVSCSIGRRIGGFALVAASFFGCLKPGVEQLEFFTVHLTDPPSFSQLGTARLRAEILDLSKSTVENCGFIYSENPGAVVNQPENQSVIGATPPASSGNFEAFFEMETGKTYYFRAFARLGERWVFSPEIEPFSLSDLVALRTEPVEIRNDQATVYGQLMGLAAVSAGVEQYGFVFSAINQNPDLAAVDCQKVELGPSNDDILFSAPLTGLEFNTDYWVKAFAVSASGKTFYSKTTTHFRMKGGWKRAADFPSIYHDGSAIGEGGFGYLGFGCDKQLCGQPYPTGFWRYQPDTGGPGAGQFEPLPNWSGGFPQTNATIFAIGDTIYVVFGEYNTATSGPFLINNFRKYSISAQTWTKSVVDASVLGNFRSRAVSFVNKTNGKVYGGGGYYFANGVEKEANDFWEYTPATGAWRQVASLPLRANESAPIDNNAGRREPVVFDLEGKIFVGGGKWQTLLLRDFWEFRLPADSSDLGEWIFSGFFPDKARLGAAAFSIGQKGYYGLGYNSFNNFFDDFWEFNGSSWQPVNDFPGGNRRQAMAFSTADRGFVGTGVSRILSNDGTTFSELVHADFWMYIPEQ